MLQVNYLDVVVEDEMALAVLGKQVESIVVGKVFELDEDFLAIVLLHGSHELLKKLMVFLETMKPIQN